MRGIHRGRCRIYPREPTPGGARGHRPACGCRIRADGLQREGRPHPNVGDQLAPTIGEGLGKSSRHLPEALQRRRAVGREHFFRAFQEAWECVDSIPAGPTIPITLADRLRRDALAREEHRGLIGRVRANLGPLDRIVRPLGSRALPLLGWLATRAARRRAE